MSKSRSRSRPTTKAKERRHSRAGGNPRTLLSKCLGPWIPACAGMTIESELFSPFLRRWGFCLRTANSASRPEGRRTWMCGVFRPRQDAESENPLSLSVDQIDSSRKAVSFGYFSLGQQRKVTRGFRRGSFGLSQLAATGGAPHAPTLTPTHLPVGEGLQRYSSSSAAIASIARSFGLRLATLPATFANSALMASADACSAALWRARTLGHSTCM